MCISLHRTSQWTLILTADFSVNLTRLTDFDSGLFRLPNLDTLILTTDFCVWYGAHSGCDRSAGDAYSSMAPDPTSDIFGGPCTPILWFVFPIRLMRLITDRYFCHFNEILRYGKRAIGTSLTHFREITSDTIRRHYDFWRICSKEHSYTEEHKACHLSS
jgi:hypothetical protein